MLDLYLSSTDVPQETRVSCRAYDAGRMALTG